MNKLNNILIASILLLSTPAFSQLSVGAQGSYLKFMESMSDYQFSGFGFKAAYQLPNGFVVSSGFNYYFKKTNEYTESFETEDLTYANVTFKSTLNAIYVDAHAKYYIIGDYSKKHGLYGAFGFGFMMVPVSYKIGEYDQEKYSISRPFDETFTNVMMSFGIGMEVLVKSVYLFGETNLNLPPTYVIGQGEGKSLSGSTSFHVGIRVPLDF